jgi:DNA-binding NarL/FixJ family response regulator
MDTASKERLQATLSALLIQINALQTLVESSQGVMNHAPTAELLGQSNLPALRDGLESAAQMARDALYTVRASCEQDRLPELEGVTLGEALSRLVEETAETLHLSSRIVVSGADEQGQPKEHELSSAAERLLLHIAREALYDVRHHAGARTIRFALIYVPDEVRMSIEDDGQVAQDAEGNSSSASAISPISTTPENALPAFLQAAQPSVARSEHSIFTDLRYRVEQLGGTLQRETQGERGMRVLVRIPYTYAPQLSTSDVPVSGQKVGTSAEGAEPIRILIVDGQAVIRAGLRRLQAVSETLELGPQVVLMDAQLPDGQSLEALRQIKQLQLDTHVLLLSAQNREEYLYETLRAGADGYVLKDIAPDELAQALRTVARGETLVQPQLAGRLLSRFGRQGRSMPHEALTARELEVLRLLARGLRNKEIAERLYISERTVNFHLANIYQKLNVSGRTEALSRALQQGLVSA